MNITIMPETPPIGGVGEVMKAHKRGFEMLGHSVTKDGLKVLHVIGKGDFDVYHCHGTYPTAEMDWSENISRLNMQIIKNIWTAKETIFCADWSAEIIRRMIRFAPKVVHNGVWLDEIPEGGLSTGKIIWPKIGLNPVCDANDVIALSEMGMRIKTCVHLKQKDIETIGLLPHDQYLDNLATASIYLGVTKENSSLAQMEAMSMGIPIVGYDFGMNKEVLQNGNGCVLVQKGDIQGLKLACEHVIDHWKEYHKQALEWSRRFDWLPRIEELVEIYKNIEPRNEKVSVVIPNFNGAKTVVEAIDSVKAQTVKAEIVVVDDCSTDNSVEILKEIPGIVLIESEKNQGVSMARNTGILKASGGNIVCLDKDDLLKPTFVEKHLAKMRGAVGIAFAPMETQNRVGETTGAWFSKPYNHSLQTEGINTVPTCCMFRKEAWYAAGGYRKRHSADKSWGEDAHLWKTIAQRGFEIVQLGEKPLSVYRMLGNSLSQRAYFPDDWWKEDPYRKEILPKAIRYYDEYRGVIEIEFHDLNDLIDCLDSLEWLDMRKWKARVKQCVPEWVKRMFPHVEFAFTEWYGSLTFRRIKAAKMDKKFMSAVEWSQ